MQSKRNFLSMGRAALKMTSRADKNDEGQLQWCMFFLQQSVEMYLEHRLSLLGVKFPKIHDIRKLIQLFGDDVDEDILRLKPYQDQLTSYEEESRYDFNFFETTQQLEVLLSLCTEIYDNYDKRIATTNVFD